MFCAYNLRRIINLIDKNLLKKYLRELWLLYFGQNHIGINILRPMMGIKILTPIFCGSKNYSSKRLPWTS